MSVYVAVSCPDSPGVSISSHVSTCVVKASSEYTGTATPFAGFDATGLS